MKEILLTKGYKTIVDDCDYEYLSQWKWYLSNGYAISNDKRKKMHRLIMNAKDGEIVDHIDRNKLNNTRSNLRIVDKEGNVHNQKKRANTNNNYKGTQYIKRLGLWQSRCRIYGNDYYLGLYKTEVAAAYAYNKKAMELSEFILLNKFDIPIEVLEQMLITDLSQIKPAEKKSTQKGVYWCKKTGRMKCGKWEAKIRINGKYKSLGRFINEDEAISAVKNFESDYGRSA
jgi:hypothetical protein